MRLRIPDQQCAGEKRRQIVRFSPVVLAFMGVTRVARKVDGWRLIKATVR